MRPLTRLPIPPTLPYSPDSVPFQRHLELLQLSLSSDTETSWLVYSAIHPSLKRFVPNYIFASLLRHQLSSENPQWLIVQELVLFAEECGMSLDELGPDVVGSALTLGVTVALRDVENGKPANNRLLCDLWKSSYRIYRGNITGIPAATGRDWLRLLYASVIRARHQDKQPILEMAFTSIEVLTRAGAAGQISDISGRLLTIYYGPPTIEADYERLRFLGWLVSQGARIKAVYFRLLAGRLRRSYMNNGGNEHERLIEAAAAICATYDGPFRDRAVQNVTAYTEWAIRMNTIQKGKLEKGAAILSQENPASTPVISQAMAILRRVPVPADSKKSTSPTILYPPMEGMAMALSLFEKVAHRPYTDTGKLVALITHRLIVLQRKREPGVEDLILRFVNTLFSANLFPHIDGRLIQMVFTTLATASRSSPQAYKLARKVYALSRSSSKPLSWASGDLPPALWKSLLRTALCQRSQPHVQFASRLYADRIADGVTVDKEDALRLIRALGGVDSTAKYILLERHLKDYQFFEYGSTEDFVNAVVGGLTARRRTNDAWFGFHLMMRILGNEPVPEQPLRKVIEVLARGRQITDYRRCVEVLGHIPNSSPVLVELYESVAGCLATLGVNANQEDVDDPKEAAVAISIELYKEMLKRGVRPTPKIIEFIVKVLIDGGFVSRARQIVQTMVEGKEAVTTESVVATVMGLAKEASYSEALELASKAIARETEKPDRQLLVAKAYIQLKRQADLAEIKRDFTFDVLTEALSRVKVEKEAASKAEVDATEHTATETPNTLSPLTQRMAEARAKG